jgi:hypothetical protein
LGIVTDETVGTAVDPIVGVEDAITGLEVDSSLYKKVNLLI